MSDRIDESSSLTATVPIPETVSAPILAEQPNYGMQPGNDCAADPTVPDDSDSNASIASDEDDAPISSCCCCSKFWAKWKYVFIVVGLAMLQGLSNIVLNPILPGIKRRYFGSDQHAALWSTTFDAVQAGLGLFLCPFSGYAMDAFGRRPFFLVAMFANLIPPVLLLVLYPNPLPYMIANAMSGLITSAYATTWIADHYHDDEGRVLAFAAVAGGGSITIIFGFLASILSDYECMIISVVAQGIALVYCFLLIKESLPADKVQKFDLSKVQNPFVAMKSVLNTKISRVTILVMGIFTVSQSGMGEVYFYYLNERLGFNKGDNGIVLMEAGLLWPAVMLLLIPLLKKVAKMHSITMVFVSVTALACEMVLMCVINAKWQVFAFTVPAAAVVNMSLPALTAVIAAGSNGEDQARRQVGLAAIGDFFSTLAPLLFGQVYSNVPKFWSFLPFAIAAVLTLPTLFMAYKLRYWIVVQGQRNLSSRNSSVAPTPRTEPLLNGEGPGTSPSLSIDQHTE